MNPLVDALIALWVISGLCAMVIAIVQERSVWRWVLMALLTGPIASVMLLRRGPQHPYSEDRGLCAECFARLIDDNRLCQRCRAGKRKPNSTRSCRH